MANATRAFESQKSSHTTTTHRVYVRLCPSIGNVCIKRINVSTKRQSCRIDIIIVRICVITHNKPEANAMCFFFYNSFFDSASTGGVDVVPSFTFPEVSSFFFFFSLFLSPPPSSSSSVYPNSLARVLSTL